MPRIATIGFFDGVHRGHRFLFAQLKELAHERGLEPLILTFDRHPKEILTGICPPMLTTYVERQQLLALHAEVRVLPFAEVQGLTAEQFMRYLQEQEQVEVLLMGYDHRFGSDQLKGFSEYEKVARRVGLHVERAHEVVVVVHWFTHSHKYVVCKFLVFRKVEYLVQDIASRKILLETLFASLAEEAVHFAAHLRRDA